MHTKFSRFMIFWTGASLCLVYLAVTLVNSGVIRWGEDGATTIACLCPGPIFLDVLFLLEYMSVLYEKDAIDTRGVTNERFRARLPSTTIVASEDAQAKGHRAHMVVGLLVEGSVLSLVLMIWVSGCGEW